jgi:hypothetical protein
VDEGARQFCRAFFVVRFRVFIRLASCKKEVDHEQELHGDFGGCGTGPGDRMRDGGNLGERMLYRRAALHGL